MDHLAFYILAAAVTIMILYVMISLAYIKRRKQAFLSMQDNLRFWSATPYMGKSPGWNPTASG